MYSSSYPECHKTAALASMSMRVINLVYQQKGYSRDAAGEGDTRTVFPSFELTSL